MKTISKEEIKALRESGTFDEAWYLEQYPDVKALGMDPAEHYLWIGKALGRGASVDSAPRGSSGILPSVKHAGSGAEKNARQDPYEYFFALSEDVQQDEGVHITRLMDYIWKSRLDLQNCFDLGQAKGRLDFKEWFLTSFEREYGISMEDQPVSSTARLDPNGVNLIGYAKGELGMGEHVRMVASSLNALGIAFDVINISAGGHGEGDASADQWISQQQRFKINIFCINADMLPLEILKYGRGHYNIGYWAWELPECPPEFFTAIDLVDEIWGCSNFVADAFRKHTNKPVITMPLAVELPDLSSEISTKEYYGLDPDKFTFLFTFDAASYLDRKNPIDIVRAFNLAFPRGDENVQLVFKVQNTSHIITHGLPKILWDSFLAEINNSPRIKIINKRFLRNEVFGLSMACDAFISLHRSEGFGRNLVEAMYYGKPVIATNFSGSSEFISEKTAFPINYKLIPVQDGAYPFSKGQYWAQPDIDEAAHAMKRLYVDQICRQQKGIAGKWFVHEAFNKHTIGHMYQQRLEQIQVTANSARLMPEQRNYSETQIGNIAPLKRTVLFTITSRNYISYARTVLDSVANHHPEFDFYLGLADEIGNDFDFSKEKFTIVTAREMQIPDFLDMTIRYDVLEFNTAIKPFMFKWILKNTLCENVIYFDPDLQLHSRLDDILSYHDTGASVVLTPHITEPLLDDKNSPNDHAMLKAGVFNLGFISIRRCDESERFVQWWGEKLRNGADADFANNLFNDQRWCDLAPCFLPNLKIIHDPSFNVAYWNLSHRQISWSSDNNYLVNGSPLVFFHFSGIDPTNIEAISKHQNRFGWDDLTPACQDLFRKYGQILLSNDWEKALKYRYSYNFLKGIEIAPFMRRVYRRKNQIPRAIPNEEEALRLLFEACNQPAPLFKDAEWPVSELMLEIYRTRPDLQNAFNLNQPDGRKSFHEWFKASGKKEYKLPSQVCVS